MVIADHGSSLREGKITKKPENWTAVSRLSWRIWVISRGHCFLIYIYIYIYIYTHTHTHTHRCTHIEDKSGNMGRSVPFRLDPHKAYISRAELACPTHFMRLRILGLPHTFLGSQAVS